MAAFIASEQQSRIIHAPIDDDVLVVAGAGSGKTTVMTHRIIELIHQGIAPERILGLTFTRKAAGELLGRVSQAVAVDDQAQGGKRNAFMKPDVSTYDAFFQSIVRQYGLLVGFDQQTQPLSQAGALQLITQVVGEHIDIVTDGEQLLGSFSSVVKSVYELSNNIANAMISDECMDYESAIAQIRAWDNEWLSVIDEFIDGQDIPQEEPKAPKLPSKLVKKDGKPTVAYKNFQLNSAQFMAEMPLYSTARLRDTATKRNQLLRLVEYYVQAKRERHMAEFSDFTIAAFQLVTRFPSIGARYRHRYTHVLLDEYQDTSTTQSQLLAKLFHATKEDHSAVSAVGDPFQAIYAFRGASPGAFRLFQQSFELPESVEPFALTETRRNARSILQAANALTYELRHHHARASSARASEVSVQPLQNVTDGSMRVVEGTIGALGYATLGQEIDGVVRFARQAIAQVKHDVERGVIQDTPGAKVAVLFRSKANMALYQEALEQAGMTTRAVGISALLERAEIIDILATLNIVADHSDANSLMRLLATPRFGLDAHDLHALARVAERNNTEYRYRALVQAGIVPPNADYREQYAMVREHAQDVPNAVFVADIVMDDDVVALLANSGVSQEGRNAIVQAGRVLRQVQRALYEPIAHVMRVAIEALNLDIDMVLAAQIHANNAGQSEVNPFASRAPIDALLATVDTYMQEIAAMQTPSLRGYLAWMSQVQTIEEEPYTAGDVPVDVELMTVHQSKGLQWPAVAIVNMEDGIFPSQQGDQLRVQEVNPSGDEDIIATSEGAWRAPEYQETAHTWLTTATAVPVPIRVDANILPQFPRDKQIDEDPLEALHRFDSVEEIDDDVFGALRTIQMATEESSVQDASVWPLTQEEEYGRRLHADERRLMYVALTRAQYYALVTYAATNEQERMAMPTSSRPKKTRKPSNFWNEIANVLDSREDSVDIEHDVVVQGANTIRETVGETTGVAGHAGSDIGGKDGGAASDQHAHMLTLANLQVALPTGFFAGEDAAVFASRVVKQAWESPVTITDTQLHLPWPFQLSPALEQTLHYGVQAIRDDIANGVPHIEIDDERSIGNLTRQAVSMLPASEEQILPTMSEDEVERVLARKAQRILSKQRLSATTLQKNANESETQETSTQSARAQRVQFVRGIVRPIPALSSPAALAGTRLHAWAEQFMRAGEPDSGVSREVLAQEVMAAQARAQQASAQGESAISETERKLIEWQMRLIESPWNDRKLAGAEQMVVAQLAGIPNLVQGKLDAVFYGGLDERDTSKQYTVIDWKTGHRPRSSQEIEDKLKQLDFYRLLLAKERGVPLEQIDAALYYLSESEASLRQIPAQAKSEEQIMTELRKGVPQWSDND